MPELFLQASLVPDKMELCLTCHSVSASSVCLPHLCNAELRWPALVYFQDTCSISALWLSKCLHSFCGSQISQNLTHFHSPKPHHPISHPEIIHSQGVTCTWLHLSAIRPPLTQNVWAHLLVSCTSIMAVQPQRGAQATCAWGEGLITVPSHL